MQRTQQPAKAVMNRHALDAMLTYLRDADASGKARVRPVQWVWMIGHVTPTQWLSAVGESLHDNLRDTEDASKDSAAIQNPAQWAVSESGSFLFSTIGSSLQAEDLRERPEFKWLLQHRVECPMVALHLVFPIDAWLSEQATPSIDGLRSDLLRLQHAVWCIKSLTQGKLRTVIHFLFVPTPALELPELWLPLSAFAGPAEKEAWCSWRIQCLSAKDLSVDPASHHALSAFLDDPKTAWARLQTMVRQIAHTGPASRRIAIDGVLIHPNQSSLTESTRKAVLQVSIQRHHRQRLTRRGLLLGAALMTLLGLYSTVGLIRQQSINALEKQNSATAISLTRQPCSDTSAWSHSLALQTGLESGRGNWLMWTNPIYPHQQVAAQNAIDTPLSSVQRWILRCVVEPVAMQWVERLAQTWAEAGNKTDSQAQLDAGYQLLKSILMLRTPSHRDVDFLIPRIQSTWLALRTQPGDWQHSPVFLEQLDDMLKLLRMPWPKDWVPPLQADGLIKTARQRLQRVRSQGDSRQWRLRPIIDSINGRNAPTQITDLFATAIRTNLQPGSPIAAAFALGAFDRHLRSALESADTDAPSYYDWVLDIHVSGQATSDTRQDRHALARSYWTQHRLAWLESINTLSPRSHLDRDALANLAHAFANLQDGPVSQLIDGLQRSGQPQFQNLATQLGLDAKTASGNAGAGSTSSSWSTYASLLSQVIQYGNPAEGTTSRLCTEPLLNPRSALHRLHEWVKVRTQAVTDEGLRFALRQFVLLPARSWAQQQWARCAGELNRAWASEVTPRQQAAARRFPFQSDGTDATPDELHTAWLYERLDWVRQLSPPLLGWITAGSPDTLFSGLVSADPDPLFLRWVQAANKLRHAPLMADSLSTFELQPIPSPDFSEQSIGTSQQSLRYRNGPVRPTAFRWTGDAPDNLVSVQATTTHGKACSGLYFSGRMGWARALLAAEKTPTGNDWILSWMPCDTPSHKVQFLYRHLSGLTPADIEGLQRWPFPNRIFKEPKP